MFLIPSDSLIPKVSGHNYSIIIDLFGALSGYQQDQANLKTFDFKSIDPSPKTDGGLNPNMSWIVYYTLLQTIQQEVTLSRSIDVNTCSNDIESK